MASKKRVVTPHGTCSKYALGCRCLECKEAKRRDAKKYRAGRGADSLVSTTKARAHLRTLRTTTMIVAKITGLSFKTVRGVTLNRFIHASAETIILRVTSKHLRQYRATTKSGWIPKRPVLMLLNDLKASGFAATSLYRPTGKKLAQAGAVRRFERTYRQAGPTP